MTDTCILYIEDNAENRLLVSRILEAEGYHAVEAVDGPSGLEAAQEAGPDLILLDIGLPKVDGYDLAERFREMPALDQVPILAVTANVMKGDSMSVPRPRRSAPWWGRSSTRPVRRWRAPACAQEQPVLSDLGGALSARLDVDEILVAAHRGAEE